MCLGGSLSVSHGVCVSPCVHVHVPRRHTWRPGMDVTMSGVSVILHLSLHRLTIKSLGSSCFCLPGLGLWVHTSTPGFLGGCWGLTGSHVCTAGTEPPEPLPQPHCSPLRQDQSVTGLEFAKQAGGWSLGDPPPSQQWDYNYDPTWLWALSPSLPSLSLPSFLPSFSLSLWLRGVQA